MNIKLINEDKRGRIISVELDGKEYLILETKRGHRRGGDYHKSNQYDIVLKGKIRTITPQKEDILQEGDNIVFISYQPHYFEALEDCYVLEWLSGPFEKKYYKPYRDLVEETMK
jgi:quercetin dioxygenase-like cupin family protein